MTKQIPLTQGKYALVDDDVYEWASKYKWHAWRHRSTLYALRATGKSPHQKIMRMHREIMNAPSGVMVDHINGDGLDNRRENLRLATNAENLRNRGRTANNTSGYKGVCWFDDRGKWSARIKVTNKTIYLGYFDTAEAAAIAYDRAAREHHGEFAKTNF